ncbi:MAG: hypothetical protein M1120_03975 [Patescibacteria group bacterium]|nr:hypothetical protein [Patescibacteria group bacterium]
MLKDLIVSRVRVKILELFLTNPGSMYHVREIVRRVNEEINAVRRELLHLEKAGMLNKERRANRLFYFFRKEHPLYYDLLALMAKTTGLGGNLIKNKTKMGKVKFAMFSGKYVRKLAPSTDSVDLLLVGQVVLPELSVFIRQEEAKLGRELNYTVMSEEEFAFRKKRRDPFIMDILSGSRTMIIGDEEELVKN